MERTRIWCSNYSLNIQQKQLQFVFGLKNLPLAEVYIDCYDAQ